MKRRLLLLNRLAAFLAFLCAFAKLFFEYGSNLSRDGFGILFLFPIFYFVILLIAHRLTDCKCYTRKPYVITAAAVLSFIALNWIVFLATYFSGAGGTTLTKSDILYDCAITFISLIMSGFLFGAAFSSEGMENGGKDADE